MIIPNLIRLFSLIYALLEEGLLNQRAEHIAQVKASWGTPQQEAPELPERFKMKDGASILHNAIQNGLMVIENGEYVWNHTNALYGFFIDKVNVWLGLEKSNGQRDWKIFSFIKGHKKRLPEARKVVSSYTHGYTNPPEGDDLVESLKPESE